MQPQQRLKKQQSQEQQKQLQQDQQQQQHSSKRLTKGFKRLLGRGRSTPQRQSQQQTTRISSITTAVGSKSKAIKEEVITTQQAQPTTVPPPPLAVPTTQQKHASSDPMYQSDSEDSALVQAESYRHCGGATIGRVRSLRNNNKKNKDNKDKMNNKKNKNKDNKEVTAKPNTVSSSPIPIPNSAPIPTSAPTPISTTVKDVVAMRRQKLATIASCRKTNKRDNDGGDSCKFSVEVESSKQLLSSNIANSSGVGRGTLTIPFDTAALAVRRSSSNHRNRNRNRGVVAQDDNDDDGTDFYGNEDVKVLSIVGCKHPSSGGVMKQGQRKGGGGGGGDIDSGFYSIADSPYSSRHERILPPAPTMTNASTTKTKDSPPSFIQPIGVNPDDHQHQRLSESDFVVLGQSDRSYKSYNNDDNGVSVVDSAVASAKLSFSDDDEAAGTDNSAIALHSGRFGKQQEEGDLTEEEIDEISVSSSMAAVEFDEHDASDEGFYDNGDEDDEGNYYRGSSDSRRRTPTSNSGSGGGNAPYWKSMSRGNNYHQQNQLQHRVQHRAQLRVQHQLQQKLQHQAQNRVQHQARQQQQQQQLHHRESDTRRQLV